MPYSLLLIIACSPLAALTGFSLWQAARSAAPDMPKAEQLDTARISKLASEAAASAAERQSLVPSLTSTDLLDANQADLDAADAKLKEAWEGWQQARRLLSKYARLGPTTIAAERPAAARLREAEAASARLKGFIEAEKQNFAGHVSGADDFFAMLQRRAQDLQKEIDGYSEQERLEAAVTAAKNDLEQGRYGPCLKRLDSDPLVRVDSPGLAAQLQELRKRAEYRRAWEELDHATARAADRDLYEKIRAFLRRYPDPPTPAEGDLQVRLERRRDRLKSEISVQDLDRADDLDTLLVEAAQIIANDQIEEPIKKKARRQVSDWLKQHLPKIEAPSSLLGKEEAVTKNGQRKIGEFYLPEGVDSYRFWTDKKKRNTLRQGEDQFTLARPPATPQYVAWAQSYQAASEGVLGAAATRDDWQQFAADCDAWQKRLTAYRQQWGVDDEPDRSCREWSFAGAGEVARNVLRKWDAYERILGQTK